MCNYNFKEMDETKEMEVISTLLDGVGKYFVSIREFTESNPTISNKIESREGTIELNVEEVFEKAEQATNAFFNAILNVFDSMVESTDDEFYREIHKALEEMVAPKFYALD